MKQHLSVWKLLIRSAVFRLALCLGVMCALESGVFLWRAGSAASFDDAVGEGPAYAIFVAAYYCLFLVLETTFCLPNQLYALERLRISERKFLLWQAFHNTLCFLILWGAEVTLIFILSLWYRGAYPENAVSPWLLLAFYRNSFLHGLLPLWTVSRWIVNLVYFTGSGILSACAALKHRHGLRVMVPHMFMVLTGVTFRAELSDPAEDIARVFFALCLISLSFVDTFEAGHPGVKLEANWHG